MNGPVGTGLTAAWGGKPAAGRRRVGHGAQDVQREEDHGNQRDAAMRFSDREPGQPGHADAPADDHAEHDDHRQQHHRDHAGGPADVPQRPGPQEGEPLLPLLLSPCRAVARSSRRSGQPARPVNNGCRGSRRQVEKGLRATREPVIRGTGQPHGYSARTRARKPRRFHAIRNPLSTRAPARCHRRRRCQPGSWRRRDRRSRDVDQFAVALALGDHDAESVLERKSRVRSPVGPRLGFPVRLGWPRSPLHAHGQPASGRESGQFELQLAPGRPVRPGPPGGAAPAGLASGRPGRDLPR